MPNRGARHLNADIRMRQADESMVETERLRQELEKQKQRECELRREKERKS